MTCENCTCEKCRPVHTERCETCQWWRRAAREGQESEFGICRANLPFFVKPSPRSFGNMTLGPRITYATEGGAECHRYQARETVETTNTTPTQETT